MQDIAGFLGSRPPFDSVGADDLAHVAAVTEMESVPAGKTIFSQGAGPVEHVWVVRTGTVEIVHDGRVLDLLGPGELFGHASMVSGLPTGFEARAGEDALCCRIPADVMRPLLAYPDVLRFIARSIVAGRAAPAAVPAPSVDLVQRHVVALIRTPPLLCRADEPIREAAKRMTAEGASAVLVRAADRLGIVTDRDFRSRVVAAGMSPDAPVSAIMSEPAYTVSADRALAWQEEGAGAATDGYMARLAAAVDQGLRACGVQPDADGASASNSQFARSVVSWRAVLRSVHENPAREEALVLLSMITDRRPVWGTGPGAPVADALWDERDHRNDPDLQRLLALFALSFRPPTGFLRDFVVEHSGERRGQLDIKHGGLTPIVDLARWAGIAAGVASASTLERLKAAEAAGTLESPQAHTLMEAFGFISSLRLDHQVEQIRRGAVPDDFIDPKTLNPLARSYLREAFRAVASVQAGLSAELSLGVRWG